jgi:hypothetical protein
MVSWLEDYIDEKVENIMKRLSSAFSLRLLFAAGVIFQLAWYGLLWSRMLTQPNVSRPTDYSIFYTAGRIAASGHYSQLYDLQTQRQVRETLLGHPIQIDQVLLFNHPPLLVPILQLISTQDYMTSYWRWVLVMLCFVAATMVVIYQLLRAMQWDTGSRWIFIISALLFYPIFVSLLKGQDTAFLLFGALLWLYGVIMKRDIPAGIGLALTLIRPQIALILAVPFFFNRRKTCWWFCAGAAVLGLYSILLVGSGGVRDFLNLLRISASGEGFGMGQNAMFNFTGMALRLFPYANLNAIHLIAWGLFMVVIIGLSIWWKISPEIDYRHIVLLSTLSVFAAPHLHYHDLALLIIPVLGLALAVVKKGHLRVWKAALSPMLVSVLFLIADWWNPLLYTMPYLIMGALPILAWYYETH